MKCFLLLLFVTIQVASADGWYLKIHKIPPGVTIYRKGNWYFYKDASGEYRMASDFRIHKNGKYFQASATATPYKTDEERKRLLQRAMSLEGVQVVLESRSPMVTQMGYNGAVSWLVFTDITEGVKLQEWAAEKGKEILLMQDIGPYKRKYEPSPNRLSEIRFLYTRAGKTCVIDSQYENSEGVGYYVNAVVSRDSRGLQLHELLRLSMRYDCEKIKRERSVCLYAKGPQEEVVSWAGTNGVAYYLWTMYGMPYEIIDAYLKAFPSSFAKHFRLDKLQWVREEMSLRLKRMQEHVTDVVPVQRNGRFKDVFWGHLGKINGLQRYIVIPDGIIVHANPKGPFTVEEKRVTMKSLKKWWGENKSRLVWDKKIQKARLRHPYFRGNQR